MRTYRNGELAGYSDEFLVCSMENYNNDIYEYASYFDTEEKAIEAIQNVEVDEDEVALVKVQEWFDGTDYVLIAKYVYNEDREEYIKEEVK